MRVLLHTQRRDLNKLRLLVGHLRAKWRETAGCCHLDSPEKHSQALRYWNGTSSKRIVVESACMLEGICEFTSSNMSYFVDARCSHTSVPLTNIISRKTWYVGLTWMPFFMLWMSKKTVISFKRNDMETLPVLLAFGDRCIDVTKAQCCGCFIWFSLNKLLNKQTSCQSFEVPWRLYSTLL